MSVDELEAAERDAWRAYEEEATIERLRVWKSAALRLVESSDTADVT